MKKRIVLIVVIIMSIVAVTMIYQTFATDSGTASDNVFDIVLSSIEEITVPALASETYYYQITNTNKGVVQYGVVYSGDNITVKVFDDSDDLASGTIDYGENKFVKLYVKNTGTSDSAASIKTVLGYEKGGSLEESNIIPEGYKFVNEVYSDIICIDSDTLMCDIIDLYKNNNPTRITHKDEDGTKIADYYYASSVNLMNDTLNSIGNFIKAPIALANGTKGNIRYYGANPNNYIYFNCDDYSNQSASTCEKWRIIGIVDGKVKIVRDIWVGDIPYDYTPDVDIINNNNNWHDATVQKLLNNEYYNNIDTVVYYYPDNVVTANFKTNKKGIKNDITRNMIADSRWYLGGAQDNYIYANNIYMFERTGAIGTNTSKTWFGKIGLVYVSDYGYASDLTMCNQNFTKYNDDNCKGTNWMHYLDAAQYFITPRSASSYGATKVWSQHGINYSTSDSDVTAARRIRPALYLVDDISLNEYGDGTSDNPYQIDVK